MSYVHNVIVSFDILEKEEPIEEAINAWLAEHCDGQRFVGDLAQFDRAYGGSKCLETPLYVGAFNYLDVPGFVEFFRALPWEFPENAQLLVKEQDSDRFELYDVQPVSS